MTSSIAGRDLCLSLDRAGNPTPLFRRRRRIRRILRQRPRKWRVKSATHKTTDDRPTFRLPTFSLSLSLSLSPSFSSRINHGGDRHGREEPEKIAREKATQRGRGRDRGPRPMGPAASRTKFLKTFGFFGKGSHMVRQSVNIRPICLAVCRQRATARV